MDRRIDTIVDSKYIPFIEKLYGRIYRSTLPIKGDVLYDYLTHRWGRDGAEYLYFDNKHNTRIAIKIRDTFVTDCKWANDEGGFINYLGWLIKYDNFSIERLSAKYKIPYNKLLAISTSANYLKTFPAWERLALGKLVEVCRGRDLSTFNDIEPYNPVDSDGIIEDDELLDRLFSPMYNYLAVWRTAAGLTQSAAAFKYQVPLWLWQKWETCQSAPDKWVEDFILGDLVDMAQENAEMEVGEQLVKEKLHDAIFKVAIKWRSPINKYKRGFNYIDEDAVFLLNSERLQCGIYSYIDSDVFNTLPILHDSASKIVKSSILEEDTEDLDYDNYEDMCFEGIITKDLKYKVITKELDIPRNGIKKYWTKKVDDLLLT